MNRSRNKDVKGFVSAIGKKIYNGAGKEILFRGVGFGSWLLPEGYMWCFPEGGDRPGRMEKMIVDLVGREKSDLFWQTYYDSYITEDDIRIISEEGFNSVRLPINARYLINSEQAMERIDSLIEWCRKYHLYVILDLHGAPGGQTGTNIDDSVNDLPELFIDEKNASQTVKIWRDLARRYKDEWIVAGYDLLNEPLPEWFSEYNGKVIPLYKEIIKAIREEDQKHLIILEGVHWATDWSIFTEKLDNNLMLQFHKYWNNPDVESLEPYLLKREELNVPIFMGEGGENNADWYCGAFRLFEDLDISWNFWTWKKMDTANSPFSINKPEDWDVLINYLNKGDKPDGEKAELILWEYLKNLQFTNSVYNPEIVRSILRRPPLRIPSIFYSTEKEGRGFQLGGPLKENSHDFKQNDGVEIGFTTGMRNTANFAHGGGESWSDDEWMYILLEKNDWVSYDFLIDEKSENQSFRFSLKIRNNMGEGQIKLSIDSCGFEDYYIAGRQWSKVPGNRVYSGKSGYKSISLKSENGPVLIEKIYIDSI